MVINKRCSRKEFLKRVKVRKGSFSEQIFASIYNCIFSELVDLHEEYHKFYSVEYDDYKAYLYKKYNIPSATIKDMLKLVAGNSDLKLCHKVAFSYGDGALEQFILSDTMKKRIEKMLLMRDS